MAERIRSVRLDSYFTSAAIVLPWPVEASGALLREHRIVRRVHANLLLEPATERTNQKNILSEDTRLQIGDSFALSDESILCRQDIEIAAESALVAKLGDRVSVFAVLQRGTRMIKLGLKLARAHHGVGDLVERIDQRTVIGRDRFVVVRPSAAIISFDPSAIEDWQGQRRADGAGQRGVRKNLTNVERLKPDEAVQIDVGIEVSMRDFDPFRSRFGAKPRRNQIRSPSDQVGCEPR